MRFYRGLLIGLPLSLGLWALVVGSVLVAVRYWSWG